MQALPALRVIVALFLLTAPAHAQVPLAVPLQPLPEELQSYIDKDSVWTTEDFEVPVCWRTAGFDADKALVRAAVKALLEDQSDVKFGASTWPSCTPADQAKQIVAITIADDYPRSQVGMQFRRNSINERMYDNEMDYIPTQMILNFEFKKKAHAKTLRTLCGGDREHCIRAIAVHEFMHAIGFLHEHIRPEAKDDPNCKTLEEGLADFHGWNAEKSVDYDAESTMNYCANMYRKPVKLSAGDLDKLQELYRAP